MSSKKPGTRDRLWDDFSKRHKRNPYLALDPLYAVPEALIGIIAGKQQGSLTERQGIAPGFLSPDEVAFERDLAKTTSGGFFCQRPFFAHIPGQPVEMTSGEKDLLAKVRDLRADLLKSGDLNPQQVQHIFDAEGKHEEFSSVRTDAYTGWLVLNEGFRAERDALKSQLGAFVKSHGFPTTPPPKKRSDKGSARPNPKEAQFFEFCGRWALETFLTWDLPVPLKSALFHQSLYDPGYQAAAGLNLFMPWYLLRDGRLDLAELAKLTIQTAGLSHLGGWLETKSTKREKLGDTRLCNALVLFRYQNLALQSRYPGRKTWDTAKQDTAFARFLNLSEESVRRVRLHLQKALANS